jgi:hypothetical protein
MPATFALGNHFREMLQHGMFIRTTTDPRLLRSRQKAFWIANGAFDIVTDITIILLPLYLVWSLRMPWKRKSVVILAFGSRAL